MRKCLIIIVLSSIMRVGYGQTDQIEIGNELLLKVIDQFTIEVTSGDENLQSRPKKGIVVVELYEVSKHFFPSSLLDLDSLHNDRSRQYEFRISLVFPRVFFAKKLPSFVYTYNERPVAFYTGLEYLIDQDAKKNRVIMKKLEPSFVDSRYSIISWRVKIDELAEDKIIILKKERY